MPLINFATLIVVFVNFGLFQSPRSIVGEVKGVLGHLGDETVSVQELCDFEAGSAIDPPSPVISMRFAGLPASVSSP